MVGVGRWLVGRWWMLGPGTRRKRTRMCRRIYEVIWHQQNETEHLRGIDRNERDASELQAEDDLSRQSWQNDREIIYFRTYRFARNRVHRSWTRMNLVIQNFTRNEIRLSAHQFPQGRSIRALESRALNGRNFTSMGTHLGTNSCFVPSAIKYNWDITTVRSAAVEGRQSWLSVAATTRRMYVLYIIIIVLLRGLGTLPTRAEVSRSAYANAEDENVKPAEG